MEQVFYFTDLLKKSKPSRIVIVASELYKLAKINLSHPNPIDKLPAYLYYVSKYANILFTLELAKRLEGTGNYYTSIFYWVALVLAHLFGNVISILVTLSLGVVLQLSNITAGGNKGRKEHKAETR